MKRGLLAIALCVGVAGCSAAGDPAGATRYSNPDVPFTFEIPADFTKASIDEGNTRGTVIAAVGLSKVDVIAVRRTLAGAPAGPVRHEVLGQAVTSELHDVPGVSGWTLECQYTSGHATKVRNACADALRTVRPR
jgi:hypothetical protein